uniref:Uncharacterized protein n=1 Tax=Xiphophorus couchianus TaxID=32473 RepID=A0A3B5L9F4_9TELE
MVLEWTSQSPGLNPMENLWRDARKIKDNAADWHNLMLKWDKLNNDGFQCATNIADVNVAISLTCDARSNTGLSLKGFSFVQVVIVAKMEHLMSVQRGIQDLEEFQFGPEGRTLPLCHSWKTQEFEESSRVLLAAFSQELKLKQVILQELAHTAVADLHMVYLSCWLHQPFIPAQTRLALEALLLETGHRSL